MINQNLFSETAKIKVGGSDLTFTKENNGIKLSGLMDGKIGELRSKDVITVNLIKWIRCNAFRRTVNTAKTGFTAPTFTKLKKVDGTDEDKAPLHL